MLITEQLTLVRRALETEEPESIFSDPLARVFAGPKAFEYVWGVARDTPEKGSSIMVSHFILIWPGIFSCLHVNAKRAMLRQA